MAKEYPGFCAGKREAARRLRQIEHATNRAAYRAVMAMFVDGTSQSRLKPRGFLAAFGEAQSAEATR